MSPKSMDSHIYMDRADWQLFFPSFIYLNVLDVFSHKAHKDKSLLQI